MVNPGGTGRPSFVISARLAPLPPSRSFWSLSPWVKSKTYWVIPGAPLPPGPPSAHRHGAWQSSARGPPCRNWVKLDDCPNFPRQATGIRGTFRMPSDINAATSAQPGRAQPGHRVVAGQVPDVTGADRRERGADLVRREHPAEDDGARLTEDLDAECRGGRHCRHPVQAVDDDERQDAGVHGVGQQRRQHQQPDAAERVVERQQDPRIDPVGERPGRDGADDVEDPDQGQQAGRRRGRHAVVVRGRHEMGADQPVRAGPADREADRPAPRTCASWPRRAGSGRSAGRRPAGPPPARPGHRRRAVPAARLGSRIGRVRRPVVLGSVGAGLGAVGQRHRGRPGSSGRTAAPAARRPARSRRPAATPPASRTARRARPSTAGRPIGPAAPPAVSTPITSPRRLTNQRFAMVAAKTSAIDPVPRPISTPQVSTSCQPVRDENGQPAAQRHQHQRAAGHHPDAEPVHQARRRTVRSGRRGSG